MARYEHDCDQCKPLGVLDEFDLYFCPQLGAPTVIARFGPDGDYLSGLGAATDGPLKEAKTRAIVAGHLTPNVAGNRLAEGKSGLTGLLGGPARSEKE